MAILATIFDYLFEIEFYGIAYAILVFSINLTLSIFIPRVLLRKFVRPPYFSAIEATLWHALPKRALLAVPFSVMVVFPRFGQRRGLSDVAKYAPRWWKIVSYLNCFLCLVPAFIWLLGAFIFVGYKKFL